MIDRYLEALEQYEMEIISVRKGRGAWICETDQGLKLLREYRGTVRRLEIEDQILGMIDTRTSLRTCLLYTSNTHLCFAEGRVLYTRGISESHDERFGKSGGS